MVIGNVLVGRVSALPGRVSKEECSWRPRSDFSVDRLVLPLRYTQRPLAVKECGVGWQWVLWTAPEGASAAGAPSDHP